MHISLINYKKYNNSVKVNHSNLLKFINKLLQYYYLQYYVK